MLINEASLPTVWVLHHLFYEHETSWLLSKPVLVKMLTELIKIWGELVKIWAALVKIWAELVKIWVELVWSEHDIGRVY